MVLADPLIGSYQLMPVGLVENLNSISVNCDNTVVINDYSSEKVFSSEDKKLLGSITLLDAKTPVDFVAHIL